MSGIWIAVLATAAGCYAFKLAGLTVPQRVLASPRVRRFAELVPVALLAALSAVQAFTSGQSFAWTRRGWPDWARRSRRCCCARRS